jgi:hypothetical protein
MLLFLLVAMVTHDVGDETLHASGRGVQDGGVGVGTLPGIDHLHAIAVAIDADSRSQDLAQIA